MFFNPLNFHLLPNFIENESSETDVEDVEDVEDKTALIANDVFLAFWFAYGGNVAPNPMGNDNFEEYF